MLFILLQKPLSFLRCFIFCPDFFGHVGKRFGKKANVNFKIYDVINWETSYKSNIAQYLKSVSNQTIKFGRLIKYNIRKNVLEKSHTKCGGETSPRLFCKKLKLAYLWINV